MQSKLSDLGNNLSEINNKECKNAWKKIELDQNVNLLVLKIID